MSKSCGGACGGDATSAADTDIQASSEAPGRWVSVYAVPKMDCPSEERMIRLALNGFEEIRALSFDLSNRRLKVVHDGEVEPVDVVLPPVRYELAVTVDESVRPIEVPHQAGARAGVRPRTPAPRFAHSQRRPGRR